LEAAMKKAYLVHLSEAQRCELRRLISVGEAPARKLVHARILLATDAGGPAHLDPVIAEQVGVGVASVARVRKRFCQEGLEAALVRRKHKKVRARRLDGVAEAHLIALACSDPPKGQQRWTLRLLANRMVELEYATEVSHECVRQTLKKGRSSRG
jgi:transposase